MEFCNKCDNIYYIEIKDGILSYKCKKCKNSVALNKNKPYLMKTNIQKKKSSYEYIINEYTKYDNTLPRIKHIKCPRCTTPMMAEEKKDDGEQKESPSQEPPQAPQAQPQKPQAQTLPQQPPQQPPRPSQNKTTDSDDESSSSSSGDEAFGINADGTGFEIDGADDNLFDIHNVEMEGGGSSSGHDSEKNEVIYIRYDDINLKYIYLCCKCNYIWKL